MVWQITFNELADYLMHGREIEFRYNGKDYSITTDTMNGIYVVTQMEQI